MDDRVKAVEALATEPLFDLVVDLESPLNFGDGPFGRRVLYGATHGSFEGPELRGEVISGGGDWALFRPDGTMTLDVRLALRTDDGEHILMTYSGRWVIPDDVRAEMVSPAERHLVDPSRYYFRTSPLFETGSVPYAWLNDIVGVASGYVVEGGVAYHVERVL